MAGFEKRTVDLKTLLFCVMLLVTVIPLAAHIYSIGKYSSFITDAEYESKRELFGTVLANTVQGKHRSNAQLAASLFSEDGEIRSMLSQGDHALLPGALKDVMAQPFFQKIDIDVVTVKITDGDHNILATIGDNKLTDAKVLDILSDSGLVLQSGEATYHDAFETDGGGVPYYLLVTPIEDTGARRHLVVITSIGGSLTGIANVVRADFEMRGMNGDLLFQEGFVGTDQQSDAPRDKATLKKVSSDIPVGKNGDYVTMIAYLDDMSLIEEADSLKFTAILVALVSLIIVSGIGTYLLRKNLFQRIEMFSKAMKNIVDGKPVKNMPATINDEFDVLSKQLQRIIDHNEERTRIKEKLENAIEEAEVANVAKSDFLANMSHELRTPLNAIIGFSEILASENMDEYSRSRTREYATDIMKSGKHLLSIINDILDLSKVEAGKMRFYEDEVDLIEISEASMRVLRNQAQEKNISVKLDAADDFPLVRADERMMQQIITNLLSNAVKFSLDGGHIEITNKITDNGLVQISVTDNGIGIAQNKLDDIMEPFHQVETSYAKSEVGTGLGLSLVKAFVEIHDGTVRIESELGKSTTVFVFLPGSRVVDPTEDSFCSLDYKNANMG